MAFDANPDANINVAAVCGKQVRVFGDIPPTGGRRPLLKTIDFPHHGAARLWAKEHDDAERAARARRQGLSLR